MLGSAPSGLEAPDKVERLPKKPKGKTNSKEKLNHEAAHPTALTLCQTDKPRTNRFPCLRKSLGSENENAASCGGEVDQ